MNGNISPVLAAGLIGLSAFLYSRLGKKRAPAPLPPAMGDLRKMGARPMVRMSIAPSPPALIALSPPALITLSPPALTALQSPIRIAHRRNRARQRVREIHHHPQRCPICDRHARPEESPLQRPPDAGHGRRLVGWDESPGLISFGNTWSEYRRMFAHFMGTRSKIDAFVDVLEEETHTYLKRILADPGAWVKHSHKLAGAIVLTLAYGYKATDEDDRLVNLVNEAMDQFSETTATNAFAVDIFPILRYVPEWFPGAAWKKKVPKYRTTLQDMLNSPYDWDKQQMQEPYDPVLSSTTLKTNKSPPTKNTFSNGPQRAYTAVHPSVTSPSIQPTHAFSPYPGGADTQKAQAELDAVIGTDRLPTLADRAHLPYFEALFTEIFRMYTLGPLGPSFLSNLHLHRASSPIIPHLISLNFLAREPELTDYCTYHRQFFKGPTTYADPEVFSPERFMASEGHAKETDPGSTCSDLGAGASPFSLLQLIHVKRCFAGLTRAICLSASFPSPRICPGIHLADASMWLACASVLAAFDIRPYMKDGKPVLLSGKYMDGTISHPELFECAIKPRLGAAAVEALLRAA
ncbi:hypothetical protein EW146_g9466 [Bondarzewia mesenterica]|uniref:Cytochrome P450 n=1 Tax=Bondarzewia mesenterica TaxID=1095465 RepID=A0A4S4L698_9AGAM|nr:hypothetical protein EW146_g9466 [Bondarzewia mesenterica]